MLLMHLVWLAVVWRWTAAAGSDLLQYARNDCQWNYFGYSYIYQKSNFAQMGCQCLCYYEADQRVDCEIECTKLSKVGHQISDLEYYAPSVIAPALVVRDANQSVLTLNQRHLIKAQTLIFEHCGIQDIQMGTFQSISAFLVNLMVRSNRLTVVKSSYFSKLANVRLLDVGYNKITYIEYNSFAGLDNVETIYLDGNQLTTVRADTFQNLNALSLLVLQDNLITYVAPDSFRYCCLRATTECDIYLSYNRLCSLPRSSFRIAQNRSSASQTPLNIYLHYNGISEIQAGAFDAPQRQLKVVLRGNALTMLNTCWLNLTNARPATFIVDANPLNCTCDTIDTLAGDVVEWRRPTCDTPDYMQGHLNIKQMLDECNEDEDNLPARVCRLDGPFGNSTSCTTKTDIYAIKAPLRVWGLHPHHFLAVLLVLLVVFFLLLVAAAVLAFATFSNGQLPSCSEIFHTAFSATQLPAPRP